MLLATIKHRLKNKTFETKRRMTQDADPSKRGAVFYQRDRAALWGSVTLRCS